MKVFESDSRWLPILREHEKTLRFKSFAREDALQIGLNIVRLAKEKYAGNVAVRIIEDDMIIFAHKMHGTSLENDWWMSRKLNVSKATGMSSLRAFMEIESGQISPNWQGRENSFVACGGCFPVLREDGETYAYIMVSGLAHYIDHQIIADAVSAHLDIQIDTIVNP